MNERKPLVSYQSDIAGMLYRPLNRMEVLLTTKNIPAKITPLKRIDGVGWIKLTKNHNRLGNQYIQEPHDEYFLNIYQKIVPSGSRVGTLLQLWQRQYPYFGDGLDRTIVPILKETFQDNEFDFLLISSDFLKGDPEIARMIKKKYTQIVSVANVIGLRRGKILLFKLNK